MTAFDFADRDVLITTSHDVAGREVLEYKGVVIADVTPGRHVGKDFLAGVRNLFGGRSTSWEHTLRDN
ncbi:MAG: heavy metal-binding domain-containing protein, partial [Candidatus Nanohaloarchaea archaeon]